MEEYEQLRNINYLYRVYHEGILIDFLNCSETERDKDKRIIGMYKDYSNKCDCKTYDIDICCEVLYK